MNVPPALFDPGSLYSPRSAATRIRRASASGRALIGARALKRLHAQGALPALRVGTRRLVFRGSDLNLVLGELFTVPESPASRGARHAAEALRREAEL